PVITVLFAGRTVRVRTAMLFHMDETAFPDLSIALDVLNTLWGLHHWPYCDALPQSRAMTIGAMRCSSAIVPAIIPPPEERGGTTVPPNRRSRKRRGAENSPM